MSTQPIPPAAPGRDQLLQAVLEEKFGELQQIIESVEEQAYQRGYEKGKTDGVHSARVLLSKALGTQMLPDVPTVVPVEGGTDVTSDGGGTSQAR